MALKQIQERTNYTETLKFHASHRPIVCAVEHEKITSEVFAIQGLSQYRISVHLGTVIVPNVPDEEIQHVRMLLSGRKILDGKYTLQEGS